MKKYMKRSVVTLTAVACIAGGASAMAANGPVAVPISAPVEAVPISAPVEAVPISAPLYEIIQQNMLESLRIYGTATSIEEGRIMLENNNENAEFDKIVVSVGEDTLILDAVTGLPMSIDDIRENETLYAYVGPAMTMSLPPISGAELVLANIPADFKVPEFAEIDRVEEGEDGSVIVHTNRDTTYTVTDDTKLFPYLTKNIVTKHHLIPGTKLLVWEPAVMGEQAEGEAGEQEEAAALKMMVFAYGYSGTAEVGLDGLTIRGEAQELSEDEQPYVENGRLMLPFRQFVEALGYEIQWDEETSGITVLNGDRELYSFTARGTEVKVGDEEETRVLFEAAAVANGVSFMSADDLLFLNNVKLVEEE
ncbi:copper amine oxidase N-terminal domain-containing protein [Paenibacillus sp. J5C_2022]|uniref:copper amine oxidase N-terminal domain-containing protein n=1 Tax=Paenibacillus sp. J5C2022 TaxID=2977129 RepID=UPI0021CF4561|nr:copper amine oxidase N-terminal domain-containing protein [Paenibacillus sp. J5C2022]MCU6712115.1 copper amine oxidase N-terminal domain-containing protein [Paenibacillus sp. J5C2022]